MAEESEADGGLPILLAYARDRAGEFDPADETLAWYARVDGHPAVDPEEGGPARFSAFVEPDELVDAVCPVDGLEHQVEAVLRGGQRNSIKVTIKLGAHRRMPATRPAPAFNAAPAPYPLETFLRPPDAAWTGLLTLTQSNQQAMWAAQGSERNAHIMAMQQTMQTMHAQTAAMLAQGAQQTANMISAALTAMQAIQRPATAEGAPAAAPAPAPDFMGQLMTHGMGLLDMAEKVMGIFGLEAKDLKGLVGKVVGGAVAAEGAEVKKVLAENFGTAIAVLADAGGDALRAKFGVKAARSAGEDLAGQVAQAAAELAAE